MEVINIGDKDSIFNQFMLEIRDIDIQKDRMRFRKNIERIGEIFAYEISKKMTCKEKKIMTPLGESIERIISNQPVLATILRAGIPLHQGVLNYFDNSDNCFIAAYRTPEEGEGFDIKVEYISSPELEGREVILCDPMLATGRSMVLALETILRKGKPKHVHIVSVISSSEGIDFLKNNTPIENCTIWVGAEDKEMTDQAYIFPGLGDAGDLAFGNKS